MNTCRCCNEYAADSRSFDRPASNQIPGQILNAQGATTMHESVAQSMNQHACPKVGVTGFEPATFCTPCRRASQVTLHPVVSVTNNRARRFAVRRLRASMSKRWRFGNVELSYSSSPRADSCRQVKGAVK